MYTFDFAAQVSRICMDEIRKRGELKKKYRKYNKNGVLICIIGLRERKILRKSGKS